MTMLYAALLAVGAVTPTAPQSVPQSVLVQDPVARPSEAQVLMAIRAEWPLYDGGAKGWLGPLEFSTWVMRAHGVAVKPGAAAGEGMSPVSAMNMASVAFARADANHDGQITPEEMARFLLAVPAPKMAKASVSTGAEGKAGAP